MNLPAPAESLCLVYMAAEQAAAGGSNEQLFLYIGLANGVCQRVRGRTRHPVFLKGNACCQLFNLSDLSRNRTVNIHLVTAGRRERRICPFFLFPHVWTGCCRCNCGNSFRSPSALPRVAASQVVPDQRPGQARGKQPVLRTMVAAHQPSFATSFILFECQGFYCVRGILTRSVTVVLFFRDKGLLLSLSALKRLSSA